jgi:hypothetical protein
MVSFSSSLSSLEKGDDMFNGCTLDIESLNNIATTIKDVTNIDGEHILDLGEYSENFNMGEVITKLESKGWTVEYNITFPDFFSDAVKIINNNFYDANDTLIGTYDTKTITSRLAFKKADNLLLFDSDLNNLVDGHAMFNGSSITSFNGDLSNLVDGGSMFGASELTSFNGNLSSLELGESMFNGCKLDEDSLLCIAQTIKSHAGHDHVIEIGGFSNGTYTTYEKWNEIRNTLMLKGWIAYGFGFSAFGGWDLEQQQIIDATTKIKNNVCYDINDNILGNIDTSTIQNGLLKFEQNKIKTFDSDLSSLTTGREMFSHCSSLTSFNSNLSSLEDGYNMFYYCYNLRTFIGDLSSLTNGHCMFYKTYLHSFNSDLSSLTNGHHMFLDC